MDKIRQTFKREAAVILAAFILGLLLTAAYTKAYSEKTAENLAAKFIRLHVIANSDTETDQQLKLNVRDEVMSYLQNKTEGASGINESRQIILSSLNEINDVAQRAIKQEGFDYGVTASLKRMSFPTKYYGDFALVAGEYEALSIQIGEAKGKNWWCVVYPPLCFVDVATASNENKARLKKELTNEEYNLVAESDKASVKIKFKAVEIWQERKLAREAKKTVAKGAR